MNNIMERYIHDVTRRLPESERRDVERELRANIADMLSDHPEEAEITRVLESLGDPRKLAEQYRANARYLISPAMIEPYIAALKIVLPIAAVATGFLGLIFYLAGQPAGSAVDAVAGAVTSVLSNALSALFPAFCFTTLGFALADYYNFQRSPRKWSVRDLPELPPETPVRIKRGETAAGMVFSAIFIACAFTALRNPGLIAWYGAGETVPMPLFRPEALSRFIPWFILVSLLSLAVSVVKLILGRWSYLLAAVGSVYGFVSAAVFLLFLTGDAFNPDIFTKINQVFQLSSQKMELYGRINLGILISVVILFTLLDIGAGWYKAYKGRRGV